MSKQERKNFPKDIVERTYAKQNGCCWKCELPLTYGYITHHIDGDNSNINEDNCALVHPRCHQSEQWKTLTLQREKTLEHIQATISRALGPEGIAGATLKEINGLIKKEILLQNQLYGLEHFELPIKERLEYDKAVAKVNLEYLEQGFLLGLQKNIELTKKVTK